jgi:addiction module RelE/StbE family toxin
VHPVIWSPAAVAQLRAIRIYIEQFNPQAAEAVAVHLLSAGNSLEHFPHRGRPVPGTNMRELVANYRYVIRYRVTRDGTVRILRVRHSSRRPTTP